MSWFREGLNYIGILIQLDEPMQHINEINPLEVDQRMKMMDIKFIDQKYAHRLYGISIEKFVYSKNSTYSQ